MGRLEEEQEKLEERCRTVNDRLTGPSLQSRRRHRDTWWSTRPRGHQMVANPMISACGGHVVLSLEVGVRPVPCRWTIRLGSQ